MELSLRIVGARVSVSFPTGLGHTKALARILKFQIPVYDEFYHLQ